MITFQFELFRYPTFKAFCLVYVYITLDEIHLVRLKQLCVIILSEKTIWTAIAYTNIHIYWGEEKGVGLPFHNMQASLLTFLHSEA